MFQCLRFLYTLLLVLLHPVLLWLLFRRKKNKPSCGKRWREFFGVTPVLSNPKPVIWVHAVSVGEVLAAAQLIKTLCQQHPDHQILVTTTTATGAERVDALGESVVHRYMPIDFVWCVEGFIRQIKPQVLFIIELELWPNTLYTAFKHQLPVVLVNARLSEKSYQNYQKIRWLITPLLQQMTQILSVHQDDSERFERLGVRAESIQTFGSIKYDICIDDKIIEQGNQLRSELGSARVVLIAASTHKGEDELILSAFEIIRAQITGALLVIVPRHPERFEQVYELCHQSGYQTQKRSDWRNKSLPADLDVFVGNTMGELLVYIQASDLVVMGGSFLGDKVGGHNFIEPAALGKFCLTGPSFYNFADLAKQLMAQEALMVVDDSQSLAHHVIEALSKRQRLLERGEAARLLIAKNQGAVNKVAEFCAHLLQ